MYFSLLLFQRKMKPVWLDAGLDGTNLDRGQYRFQPIKFVNSVVPSPGETQSYNNEHHTALKEQLFVTR